MNDYISWGQEYLDEAERIKRRLLVIRAANEEFAPVPDAVVWLDIPVSVALERIGSRGERDAFETEAGLTACRNVFASIHEPWMLRVDADAGKEEVAARVRKALSGNFPEVISE